MIQSFAAVPSNREALLDSLISKLNKGGLQIKVKNWSFVFFCESEHIQFAFFDAIAGSKVNLVGYIANEFELRRLGATVSTTALTCSTPVLLNLLRHHFGSSVFNLIEGAFNYIEVGSNDELVIITDTTSQQPVFFAQTSTTWVTTELKNIGFVEQDAFDFVSPEVVLRNRLPGDGFLPIKNAERLRASSINCLKRDSYGKLIFMARTYELSPDNTPQFLPKEVVFSWIDELISDSINNAIPNNEIVGIPLSGGLDSSLVTAIASGQGANIKTYSMGTELGNEFEYARIVAEVCKTEHTEFLFTSEDILKGICDAIYHNEIFDGLSAEIQSGLFSLYRRCSDEVDTMITGYGSDLMFGGVLNLTDALEGVNDTLWEQIYRTRWTGEFSPIGAANYGIQVRHPFWSKKLISFCKNLDPVYKLSVDDVKPVLREFTEKLGSLPDEIVHRKKIGIHEGSAVNLAFAESLGVDVSDYARKTRFTFSLYKEMLKGKLHIDEVNTSVLQRYATSSD
jgi:carbapenam-3-carboxylate synthase